SLIHMVRTLAENIEPKTVDQHGRTVHVITGRSGEQFAWWSEQGHVVATITGANVELPVAVAAGRKPNLRSNISFQEFQSSRGTLPILQIWADLQRALSLAIRNQVVGEETLTKLGFDN